MTCIIHGVLGSYRMPRSRCCMRSDSRKYTDGNLNEQLTSSNIHGTKSVNIWHAEL